MLRRPSLTKKDISVEQELSGEVTETGGRGQSVNSKIQHVPGGNLHSGCAGRAPQAGASLPIFVSGSFNEKKTHQECFRHSTISEQQNLRNLMGAGASTAGVSDLWASAEPLPEGGRGLPSVLGLPWCNVPLSFGCE